MATGRPRGFDIDERLDRAMHVFWRQGYEGTALSDLTEAMGINRPSLYAAYGNKESLFFRALDRYQAGPAGYVLAAFEEPTARAVAERLLYGAVDVATSPDGPGGCLFVFGALATGEQAEPVRREMAARRRQGVAQLRERFERAQAEGDLARDVNAESLSRYVWSVSNGVAIQAAAGATREELREVVGIALNRWPSA